jgi:hypothetical protein
MPNPSTLSAAEVSRLLPRDLCATLDDGRLIIRETTTTAQVPTLGAPAPERVFTFYQAPGKAVPEVAVSSLPVLAELSVPTEGGLPSSRFWLLEYQSAALQPRTIEAEDATAALIAASVAVQIEGVSS